MAQAGPREHSRWKRFATGIVVTVVMAAVGLVFWGPGDSFEMRFQDLALWRTRPRHEVSPDITIIEIDDAALTRIEKWPWSWDKMAGILDALTDLGARAVVLDIIYSECPAEDLRKGGTLAEFPDGRPLYAPPGDAGTGAQAPPTTQAARPVGVEIDPLPILASAVARSARAVLTYSLSAQRRVSDPLYEKIEAALVAEPGLSTEQVAAQLGVPIDDIAKFYLTARRRALEIIVTRAWAADSVAEPSFDTILPGADDALRAALDDDFQNAVQYARQQALLTDRAAVWNAADGAPTGMPQAGRATAPVLPLIEAAAGLGFANVIPDADGVVRRVPLAMTLDGRIHPQLGLAAALFAMGVREYGIALEGHHLKIDTGGEVPGFGIVADIPVNDRGEMIVNWSRGRGNADDGFRHLPITKIYQYWRLLAPQRIYDQAMVFAADVAGKTDERSRLAGELLGARRSGRPAAEVDALAARLRALDDRLIMDFVKLLHSGRPKDMAERRWDQAMAYGEFLGDYTEEEAQRITRQLAVVREELRDAIEGRLCFVGMTATSASLDLKPTPLHRDYPGVFAHATVADNILRRDFVRGVGTPVKLSLVLLVGLAVTLVTGYLPTLRATLASLGVMAVYLGLCWVLFVTRGVLVVLVGPLAAGGAALLAIMVYRELTEGRSRRWITGVFKQYNSDAMVDEIVANPDFLVLGGQRREMTVYFSDIAGFTGLSERLDAPQLVAFLQTYLEEMTDRLLEQGATLDKYEGDAVIAFFGAPLAQADHAARCLRAALAHLRALPRLNEKLHADGLLPADHDLKIRIGISSGQMAVGNFGSTRRFDYTVIGDAVNVGARLEGANRMFRTVVLVSAATHDQVGDGAFLLRRIGPVRFVGKAEAIDVYELLDHEKSDARAGLDLYDAGLKEFEGGWYHEARQEFEQALAARPGDSPTLAYLQRVDAFLRDDIHSPPGPWDMTEK